MNTFDKIKQILYNIPPIYYIIFILMIISIQMYNSYSLTLYKNITNTKKDTNDDNILFKNETVRYKYNILQKVLGTPPLLEINNNLFAESVTWRLDFEDEKFIYGKYNGLDLIRLTGYVARKNHPIPAPVYVIVGKYINVPEHLYGPIKYASPTINIEQIYIPETHNLHYEKTGEKTVSMVTGSCASITISAITIKFVEDMVEKYKNNMDTSLNLHIIFRKEYNLRILTYICGQGIKPEIDWYEPLNFKEDAIYNSKSDVCKLLKNNTSLPLIYKKDNMAKILDSIDNNVNINENTLKDLFKN
jgi:hypothetical protein